MDKNQILVPCLLTSSKFRFGIELGWLLLLTTTAETEAPRAFRSAIVIVNCGSVRSEAVPPFHGLSKVLSTLNPGVLHSAIKQCLQNILRSQHISYATHPIGYFDAIRSPFFFMFLHSKIKSPTATRSFFMAFYIHFRIRLSLMLFRIS